MNTRCKVKGVAVSKKVGFNGHEFVYDASFNPCYGDTPENKAFFAATPSISLTVCTVAGDVFQPGKDYYLDFSQAD